MTVLLLTDTKRPLKCAAAGWPRPSHEWRVSEDYRRCPELPDKLPVPWINGPPVEEHGDWHAFRPHALQVMQMGRLCLICGKKVEGPIYIIAQGHPEDGRYTSGGGGHARCMLLAVKRCPHTVERAYGPDDVIGWRWDGPGLGLLPRDDQCHGDHDEVSPEAVEITLRELREAVAR